MKPKRSDKSFYIALGVVIYLMTLFFSLHWNFCSQALDSVILWEVMPAAIDHMSVAPFEVFPLNFKAIFLTTVAYGVVVMIIYLEYQRNRVDAQGIENGSAKWFSDWKAYIKKYVDPEDKKNMIFSNEVKLNMNIRKTRKNNNVLVIGGSGTGKSRFVVKPNLLQANCSYVVTDPKGELLQTQAWHLEQKHGYKIKSFDLTDMTRSSHYNPFHYIRDENGVITMVKCLMDNTRGQGEKDDFWTAMATNVITALCFFCIEELPEEERNFGTVMQLFKLETVDDSDPDHKSVLNEMMDDLAERNSDSMAVKFYTDYKKASGKTAQSILSTVASRLQYFNFKSVVELTSDDTMELEKLGDEKQALFVVIPPSGGPFNFLVSMMYSQLFETLFHHASHDFIDQKLPVHVRFLLDEFANVGTIPEFDQRLSVMRSFEISCTVILQSLSQLKKMYEKEWEVIIDNCDSFLFLGCQGKTTLEYVNQKLGKTTIRSKDTSRSLGKKGGANVSRKHETRDLMTVSEISQMPDNNCILFIRGMDPFYCTKFKLESHKNYEYSGDANKDYMYFYNAENHKKYDNDNGVEEIEAIVKEGRDVNVDRINREKDVAEAIQRHQETGEPMISKNGYEMCNFKPLNDVIDEVIENGTGGNITIEKPYDSGYEFRTNKPMMIDLHKLNLSANLDVEEPELNEFDDEDFSELLKSL